jgi:hypothetical protein
VAVKITEDRVDANIIRLRESPFRSASIESDQDGRRTGFALIEVKFQLGLMLAVCVMTA